MIYFHSKIRPFDFQESGSWQEIRHHRVAGGWPRRRLDVPGQCCAKPVLFQKLLAEKHRKKENTRRFLTSSDSSVVLNHKKTKTLICFTDLERNNTTQFPRKKHILLPSTRFRSRAPPDKRSQADRSFLFLSPLLLTWRAEKQTDSRKDSNHNHPKLT